MTGKHTPGPWSTDHICFDRKIPVRGGVTAYGRPFVIAHVNRPGSAFHGQDAANARLIAAAPALLQALQELCDQIGETELHGDGAHDDGCPICIAHQDARAAIAQATGQ